MRDYPVGSVWTVPYSLMSPADPTAKAAPAPAPVSKSVPAVSLRRFDRVEFTATKGKHKGKVVAGTVERINQRSITVIPDEPEAPGHYWRVSPGMLRKAAA